MRFDNIEAAAAFSPTVNINEESVKGAKRKASRKHRGLCIIARGLAYSVPGATRIDVTADRAKFNYEGYRFTFDLAPKVGVIAVKFDDTGKWKPTKFRLNRASVRRVESRPPSLGPKRRIKYGTGPYSLGKKKPRKSCQRYKARRWHGLKINPLLKAA